MPRSCWYTETQPPTLINKRVEIPSFLMELNQTITNNLSKIFKGNLELSNMYSSISGGIGKEINPFDTNSIGGDTSFDIIVKGKK